MLLEYFLRFNLLTSGLASTCTRPRALSTRVHLNTRGKSCALRITSGFTSSSQTNTAFLEHHEANLEPAEFSEYFHLFSSDQYWPIYLKFN